MGIAFACGLLPLDVHKTLGAIVAVRNRVAHDDGRFALRDAHNQLGQIPAWRVAKARGFSMHELFHAIVAWLLGWLESEAEGPRLQAPRDVGEQAWEMLCETTRALPAVLQEKISDLDLLISALEREEPMDESED